MDILSLLGMGGGKGAGAPLGKPGGVNPLAKLLESLGLNTPDAPIDPARNEGLAAGQGGAPGGAAGAGSVAGAASPQGTPAGSPGLARLMGFEPGGMQPDMSGVDKSMAGIESMKGNRQSKWDALSQYANPTGPANQQTKGIFGMNMTNGTRQALGDMGTMLLAGDVAGRPMAQAQLAMKDQRLKKMGMDRDDARFDRSYGLDERRLEQQGKQFDKGYGLDRERLDFTKVSTGIDAVLKKYGIDTQVSEGALDRGSAERRTGMQIGAQQSEGAADRASREKIADKNLGAQWAEYGQKNGPDAMYRSVLKGLGGDNQFGTYTTPDKAATQAAEVVRQAFPDWKPPGGTAGNQPTPAGFSADPNLADARRAIQTNPANAPLVKSRLKAAGYSDADIAKVVGN